ncbi:hypothetical protein M0L20_15935 [Spirosoma sp. RP8]|uniref:pPIWI-RE three-gene island domain-containing protein n=1 Tax=Spirosoma liriopis TaxID=2937440 RepID=A0ABT0HNZ4_9BACT|nr:hypothetical protein [Spirosoma liriopis]MCK8493358.1 hypothetical protein [Spirosoma liriopis]
MNTFFRPTPNRAVSPSAPLFSALNTPDQWTAAAIEPRPSKRTTLSAGQLLDIELGLFLLSQLVPAASPDDLPNLLSGSNSSFLDRPTWTPKQLKILNRGRAILSHIQQHTVWSSLLDAYTTIPDRLQAYDISADRSRFCEKTVGFFRNRIFTLKQMVS